MTPERIEQMKRAFDMYGSLASHSIIEMLTGLEDLVKYKAEAERLNEICKQLAGEEMLFQEGKYETEMQRLSNKVKEKSELIVSQAHFANELQHQLELKTDELSEISNKLKVIEKVWRSGSLDNFVVVLRRIFGDDNSVPKTNESRWTASTVQTKTMIYELWGKKSDYEGNMDRLSIMCHKKYLERIKKG